MRLEINRMELGSHLWMMLLVPMLLLMPTSVGYAQEKIDFGRDIQPILAEHCYTCHGPDKESREAKLRLDVREIAVTVKRRGAAIVPGKPSASKLVKLILADDVDDQMPPEDFKKPLNQKQKQLLVKWIEQGAKYNTHWSFTSIDKPKLPARAFKDPAVKSFNEIDHFVQARLAKLNIKPAPEIDRAAYLRRVTQDITGLPPTIEQLDAFINDRSANAYEKVVDRLLNSIDYAERMAAIWLDNARYADSNGYQFDNTRKMWPWRDWVIGAYKKNMPFDQFVTEQLAGDLIPKATEDQKIATGFNRNHGFTIEGGVDGEEYRVMYINDKTTTAGTLFLGLTFECSRCHDHKYDPISTKEYYSLYAFFNTSAESGIGAKGRPIAPIIKKDGGNVMIMQEKARKTHVLIGGQFTQHGDEVQPDTPAALPPFGKRTRNRLGLARWLTAKENPLLARVTVNRAWQQFFGIGLFKTVDNLGIQGESPSHPQLLDWLATDFRDSGWDMHHLIKKIVLSATYRQNSKHRIELQDPDNRKLARGPTFRLPAESIRDQALAVSGLLMRKVGGPSVMPYQPAGIWEDLNAPSSHVEYYKQGSGSDLYRKSMYTFWRRAAMHPGMSVFDAPSRDVCSVKRATTNTPLQALALLHDPTYIEAARKLAEFVIRGGPAEDVRNEHDGDTPGNHFDVTGRISGVKIKDVSSQYSAKFAASNVVNGVGLTGNQHGAISDRIAWLNAGIKDTHTKGVGARITFDLGKNHDLASMHVWNYNESRGADLSRRGVKDVEILIDSNAAGKSFKSVGVMTLARANGKNDYRGKSYNFAAKRITIKNARLIRFNIKSTHGGDSELVGLSEVQFIRTQQPLPKTPKPLKVKKPTLKPKNKSQPGTPSIMIAQAFRRTLSRHATDRELALLNNLYRQRMARYRLNPRTAAKLLGVGDSPADSKLNAAQVAAMADVCLAIFNLSEAVTRK
jgi:hypothetical protein